MVRKEINNYIGIIQSYINIGNYYYVKNIYEKAIKTYKSADSLINVLNCCDNEKAKVLNNIGMIYFNLKDEKKALENLNNSLVISEKINYKYMVSQVNRNLALVFNSINKYSEAMVCGLKSYEISKEIKSLDLEKQSCFVIAETYEKMNNYNSALEYFKLYKSLNDSIYNIQKIQQIKGIETKYETEKKDLEIENQKLTIEKNEKLLNQTIIIIALIALFLLTAIILWLRTRAKNIQLVKQNLDIVKCQKIHKSEVVKKEIQPQLSQSIYDKLLVKFEEEKIYTKTDLTLDNLAEILQTNRTYLSQVINEQFNVNFSTLLNKYRVNEARNILSDKNSDIPIKLLYEQLGFNSMATFYEAFKKHTGITPSFFRKQAIKDL